jgi:hypothetical protein
MSPLRWCALADVVALQRCCFVRLVCALVRNLHTMTVYSASLGTVLTQRAWAPLLLSDDNYASSTATVHTELDTDVDMTSVDLSDRGV